MKGFSPGGGKRARNPLLEWCWESFSLAVVQRGGRSRTWLLLTNEELWQQERSCRNNFHRGGTMGGRGHTTGAHKLFFQTQGRTNLSFSTNYQGNELSSPYSKGTQTLLSTARVHKPFFLQQGYTNPSSTARAHKPCLLQQGHRNPSFTARTQKPFLLQQGHTNLSFYSKVKQNKPFLLQQGIHTFPSTARSHKPFLLQQGHTNKHFAL